jgi:23S rRNA (uracil1939-C5)-methyltransferase
VELVVQGGARGWTGRALVERVPAIVAVWHEATGTEKGPSLVLGTPGARGGTSFEQVNRDAAVALRDYVLEVVGAPSHLLTEEGADKDESAVELVDAYCGNGTYGRALASRGWSVVGIELDASAVKLAENDAPENFSVVRGSVEMLLPDTLPADVLLVNPPRGGLDASVPPLILNNPPERIVYVSCDAGTLSRDLRALESRYEVESVKAFDLFPQTAHVETLVALRRVEDGA